jgi:hypothetical protein
MKWIVLAALVATVGCYRAGDGSLGLDADGGGDSDVETDSESEGDEWTLDDFDCSRACDVDSACDAPMTTPAAWVACVEGCEEDLADPTPEQEDAVECVWGECVLGFESGDVLCDGWVDCINACTGGTFDGDLE